MAEARSPPARTACTPHPVRTRQRGIHTTEQKACLEIYYDQVSKRHARLGRIEWSSSESPAGQSTPFRWRTPLRRTTRLPTCWSLTIAPPVFHPFHCCTGCTSTSWSMRSTCHITRTARWAVNRRSQTCRVVRDARLGFISRRPLVGSLAEVFWQLGQNAFGANSHEHACHHNCGGATRANVQIKLVQNANRASFPCGERRSTDWWQVQFVRSWSIRMGGVTLL